MNCSEFETRLRDERRDLEAAELVTHAGECGRCSALLESEQLVSAALGLLRDSSTAERAPDRLELRLLAEFRSRQPKTLLRTSSAGFRYSRVWLAAAAVVLIAAGVIVARIVLRPEATGADQHAAGRTVALETAGPAPPVNEPSPATSAPRPVHPETSARGEANGAPIPPRSPVRGEFASGRSRAKRAATATEQPGTRIEVTPFFATMVLSRTDSAMDLQLVRVPVSRTTLEEFGITTDPRQPNRPVKADLLIGPDGHTRAIRFVSESR